MKRRKRSCSSSRRRRTWLTGPYSKYAVLYQTQLEQRVLTVHTPCCAELELGLTGSSLFIHDISTVSIMATVLILTRQLQHFGNGVKKGILRKHIWTNGKNFVSPLFVFLLVLRWSSESVTECHSVTDAAPSYPLNPLTDTACRVYRLSELSSISLFFSVWAFGHQSSPSDSTLLGGVMGQQPIGG